MPLYEYKCNRCGRHTEKRQKFSDPELTECPHCGGPLERVVSAPAISFKGGGWFKDGYGNAKPASTSGEKTGESGGGSASSKEAPAAASTGSETKAAAPAPSAPAATPAAAPASSSTDK